MAVGLHAEANDLFVIHEQAASCIGRWKAWVALKTSEQRKQIGLFLPLESFFAWTRVRRIPTRHVKQWHLHAAGSRA